MSGDVEKARAWVLDGLKKEMDRRPQSRGLEWIDAERLAVVRAANDYALAHGLPTVSLADVEGVEQRAIGHIDYASKLALYVGEMVVLGQIGATP